MHDDDERVTSVAWSFDCATVIASAGGAADSSSELMRGSCVSTASLSLLSTAAARSGKSSAMKDQVM